MPLIVIERQLGHSNLAITSIYLQGIDNAEIIKTVHARRPADDPGEHIAAALTAATATLPLARSGRPAARRPCAVGSQIGLPSTMTSTRPGQGASIPAMGDASSSDGDS